MPRDKRETVPDEVRTNDKYMIRNSTGISCASGWEMLHLLVLNAVVKIDALSYVLQPIVALQLGLCSLQIASYCKQATVTIIWLLLHIGIF